MQRLPVPRLKCGPNTSARTLLLRSISSFFSTRLTTQSNAMETAVLPIAAKTKSGRRAVSYPVTMSMRYLPRHAAEQADRGTEHAERDIQRDHFLAAAAVREQPFPVRQNLTARAKTHFVFFTLHLAPFLFGHGGAQASR